MALKDKIVGGIPTFEPLATRPSYTLSDLREDDEFVKTAERYLTSLGEGENVDDMFQYFRGQDFNLYDTHKVYRQSKDFTEQQKKDYLYLSQKFQNANVGNWKEKAQLGIDIAQELATDPLTVASALFMPWTGGTSVAGRLATGEATKAAIKSMVGQKVASNVARTLGKTNIPKGVLTAGQVLEKPLTNKQVYALLATEGFGYGGTYDYITQSREVELGLRDGIDFGQTTLSAGIAAAAAPALLAGGKQLVKIPSRLRRIEEERITKIDNNENYKPTLTERGTQAYYNLVGKYGGLILKPTTPLLPKAEREPMLMDLLRLFRFDAAEGFIAPALGKQKRLSKHYDYFLKEYAGNYQERIKNILKENKLFSFDRKNVAKQFSAGAFFNPFRSQTIRTRKSLKFSQMLTEATNNDLAYYLRSGKKSITTALPNGKTETRKLADNIIQAGDEIRPILDEVIFRAEQAGIKVGTVENFFPRFWRTDVIKANKDEFIDLIKKQEGLGDKEALEIWEELATSNTPTGSSGVLFNSRLKKSRQLKKIDDATFGKFLDNDVKNVLDNYFLDAGKIIIRTELFGETEEAFVKKWIKPIQKNLGTNKLTNSQVDYLKDLYNYTTGVKGQINTTTWYGKLGQAFSDFMTVTMQTALLPFSTLTSLAELGVPLLKAGPVKDGLKAINRGVVDSASEWWRGTKTSFGPYIQYIGKEFKQDPNIDIRSQNRQDLNAFLTSLDVGAEDRVMAIYGQAVGKTATKAQNAFFKTIGLYDWTRFVQLVGYDLGKSIIYRNLKTIDDFNKGIINNTNKNQVNVTRLMDELRELDIDVDNGLKWLDRGAKHTDAFFMKDVRAGAVRYTDQVVMNPTAASAQKPLLHSRAGTKWIYGLTGFPTAFSNTALRNVVRDLTRDGRTIAAGGSKFGAVHTVAGALFMIQVAGVNHTIRTGGRDLEKYGKGEITAEELIMKWMPYTGLMGPFEMAYRYDKATEYESRISAALSAGIGPNLPDLIDYLGIVVRQGGVAEIALKRAPFSGAFKSLDPEGYKEALKAARELDKKLFVADRPSKKDEPVLFSKGGIVKRQKYNLGSLVTQTVTKPLVNKAAKKSLENSWRKTYVETGPLASSQKMINEDLVPDFEGKTLYHGSPYDFEKFEAGEKLLSGEGANAYGKGLYFTETESIAQQYKKDISAARGTEGKVYEVKAKTTERHFLDWDTEIKHQDQEIQGAVEGAIEDLTSFDLEDFIDTYSKYPSWAMESKSRDDLLNEAYTTALDLTGEMFIHAMNKIKNRPAGASIKYSYKISDVPKKDRKYVEDSLHKFGVQGIKYLDGFSRKAGIQSKGRNYVIFDPRIIDISKKYGIPIPLAGKLLMEQDLGLYSQREDKAKGGLIEGPEVPFTKEDPADRVDPFTGEPYQEQMSRLGFNKGGLTDAEVLEMVADKPWFQRAAQPGGKFLDDEYGRHTLLTTSSGADNKEYLYPRIREVDGELVDFKDRAFQEAIDRKDYIVFEGPNRQQEATEVSKKISELIMPMRQLNKQQVEGRLNFAEGGSVQNNINSINTYLKDLGYSKEARAGILGNIGVETGYTYNYQAKQRDGKGYGLFQFDFQKPHYFAWIQKNKLDDSDKNQITFMHEVLKGNDKVMGFNTVDRQELQKFFKQGTVEQVAKEFSERYEKPGVPHLERRIEEANKLYNVID